MTVWHRATDPEPGIGTVLQVGGPADHITFTRGVHGWTQARNGDAPTWCSYRVVEWWAPLRVVGPHLPARRAS